MRMKPTEEVLGRRLNDVEEKYAPESLDSRGDVGLLSPEKVRVALVGSRGASEHGLRRSRKLARLLAGEGIIVVSGLARGIDTAAHRGAIEAGGRTIAVLGTGIDYCYPPENQALQEEIERHHLLVSQFPPGSLPRKHSFPQRNRTMALVSDATVIIEAGDTSGTLHQGWEALRLARPLFLLQSILERDLEWPEKMLQYGAKILRDVEDVLAEIPSPEASPVALAI